MAKRGPTPKAQVTLADAIVVGPDEVLVIKIGDDRVPQQVVDDISAHLKERGWEDRVLVLVGASIEFAKVAKAEA